MATLYLLQYNNYYNRIVKKETSLNGYMQFVIGEAISNINFIPNDYVDTEQIVNWSLDNPDYLLVTEDNKIVSRWFVVSTSRLREGQLRLTLHRDLVADFYDNLLDENTKIFVEKAILPADNNLIFNNEAMSFNQIKTKETLIKDASGCPWLCVFAARDNADGTTKDYQVNLGASVEIGATLTTAQFNSYKNNPQVKGNAVLFGVNIFGRRYNTTNTTDNYFVQNYGDNNTSVSEIPRPYQLLGEFKQNLSVNTVRNSLAPQMENINNNLYTVIDGFDGTKYQEFRSLANKNIRVKQSDDSYKYYSVTVQENGLTGTSDAVGKIWSDYIRPAIEGFYHSNVPTSDFGSGQNFSTVA